jgi:hypothetical protein
MAGSSASPYADKRRLYALADPQIVAQYAKQIAPVLGGALGTRDLGRCVISIPESGAWLRASLKDELWVRRTAPVMPTAELAQAAATKFLRDLDQACSASNAQWPKPLGDYVVLPPAAMLSRAEMVAVPRPDGSAWDHWLFRAEPQLMVDGVGVTRAGVFGAHVEVRIGDGGRIIDFVSRWRALTRERGYADPRPFVADPNESEGQDKGPLAADAQLPPVLGYLLEGDGIPQYYLAPYWFKSDGHSLSPSSASTWSLTVDIGRIGQDDREMTLLALARGGSGQYDYNWAAYRYEALLEGYRELDAGASQTVDTPDGRSTSSAVRLANGIWVAMVNVRDRSTGAFKHHQQLVFSSPFSSASSGSGLPVA